MPPDDLKRVTTQNREPGADAAARDRVQWPALVRYAGEAELTWIASAAAWRDDPDYHAFDYTEHDILIDSSGARFALTARAGNRVLPTPLAGSVEPAELSALLRAHCAAIGACCVAKLSTASAAECIALVGELRDA